MMAGMEDPRAAEGVEHLQAAAKELLLAARSFLNVVEEVVEDRDRFAGAATDIVGLLRDGLQGAMASTAPLQPWEQAAWRAGSGDAAGAEPGDEHAMGDDPADPDPSTDPDGSTDVADVADGAAAGPAPVSPPTARTRSTGATSGRSARSATSKRSTASTRRPATKRPAAKPDDPVASGDGAAAGPAAARRVRRIAVD